MSASDLLTAMTPVIEASKQIGIPYHISGSVASSAIGMARSTADVDLVAELGLTALLRQALEDAGLETR